MIRVKKLDATAILPSYAHPQDAGMDFYANATLVLQPGEHQAIPTGISMAIPPGFVGLIWDKSGLAAKHGLKTMAGVIDSGYRGEIKIVVKNLSNREYSIESGKKIAQMLIQPITQKSIVEVATLDDTSRGSGGFGSTGN
jgi:dUTP pyrophosphatase